jgi:DNA mismatch repair protein MSH4
LADSQTFTRTLQKVNLNDPQKILVPLYAADNASETNNLMQLIQLQFPHISIVSLSRKYFNDEIGKQHINEYGLQEDAAGLLVGLSTK